MSISFRPLWISLAERGMSKSNLREALGISTATLARMGKDEFVSMQVVDDICSKLDVPIEKVIRYEKSK
jgi:DNA-binding Xre family transcriptional regulator